ncbi:MAG: YncE family protein [candidate division Zixibacteria bacterium]|nr:YncE family protein [candidate division Zixibacteria bacterium]
MRSMKRFIGSALLALIVAGCSEDPGVVTPPGITGRPEQRIYVLNQGDGTIYAYDANTLARYDSISAGVPKPHHIEFSPDHEFAYVVNRDAGGKIAKFGLDNDSLISVATGGVNQLPTAIAISAGGTIGYTTDFNGSGGGGHIHRYNLTTMTHFDSTIQAGDKTHDIKLSVGGTLIAGNFGSDDITFVNTDNGDVEKIRINPLRPPGATYYGPYGLAIDETDSLLYIACRTSKQVKIMDLRTRTVIDSVAVPGAGAIEAGPCQMRLSSDRSKLYVTTQNDNSVAIINTTTRTVTKQIATGVPQPFGIYPNDDGSRMYVACVNTPNQNGRVYIINTSTDTIIDSLSVGRNSYMVHYHDHGGHGHP